MKRVSKSIVMLILSFYEGQSEYLAFNSVSRYYFGAIKDGNLRNIKIVRGAHFWEENRSFAGNYEQHRYSLDFFDYNGDGIKDIAVKNKLISRVYSYRINSDTKKEGWVAY